MKIVKMLFLIYVLCSFKPEHSEVYSSLEFNRVQNKIVIKYFNSSDSAYYINRNHPYIKLELTDNNQNPELILEKVIGYQNLKIQEYLHIVFLIAQNKNGFGLGMKEDLGFYYSSPNNISNRNMFILLPPRSNATYIMVYPNSWTK